MPGFPISANRVNPSKFLPVQELFQNDFANKGNYCMDVYGKFTKICGKVCPLCGQNNKLFQRK